MGPAVEVLGLEERGHAAHHLAVEQDGPQDGHLGLEVVRRDALDRRPGGASRRDGRAVDHGDPRRRTGRAPRVRGSPPTFHGSCRTFHASKTQLVVLQRAYGLRSPYAGQSATARQGRPGARNARVSGRPHGTREGGHIRGHGNEARRASSEGAAAGGLPGRSTAPVRRGPSALAAIASARASRLRRSALGRGRASRASALRSLGGLGGRGRGASRASCTTQSFTLTTCSPRQVDGDLVLAELADGLEAELPQVELEARRA